MANAIFHIGFGKTGTSSIQASLCQNEELFSENQAYKYLVVSEEGEILSNEKVRYLSGKNGLGYCSSTPNFADLKNLREIGKQVEEYNRRGITPVFSQEDWARRAGDFTANNVFREMGITVDVVAYVRPQVEWMNSGWWQWFAWNSQFKAVQDVTSAWGTHFISWAAQLSNWEKIQNVNKVDVRLHSKDVVTDFFDKYLKVSSYKINKQRSNVSLPPILVKLLLNFSEVRTEHSAHVDEKLSKAFPGVFSNPWVITREYAEFLLKSLEADNKSLLRFISAELQEEMLKDDRWWSITAYLNKCDNVTTDFKLSEEEKDLLLKNMLDYIISN